ncbi:hypothetical protein LBMAG42_27980 [Deltaproteobacteria bacterium]|nr:hypothetical protein LBMAG42_27980 [Deltaproteobacteria bacterium]
MLWLLLACSRPPVDLGVYKSGENAVIRGSYTEPVRVWGPAGTFTRVPTPGPEGTTLLGEAGPLWVVDRELPAVEKGAPVPAALVERAGFRLREVLGSTPSPEIDPVRGAGVSLRSVVKMRRNLAPPVYLAVATRGAHGIPGEGGRSAVESPEDCIAALAVLDAEASKILSSAPLPGAESTCAVPVLATPLDIDGDGQMDVLVHGQAEAKGFRAWFGIAADGTLTPGATSVWAEIP